MVQHRAGERRREVNLGRCRGRSKREGKVFANLPELETKRLLLRKMRLGDAEAMFAYASDPEVARYVLWETLRSRNA